jgi:hypothetical protein
MSVSFYRESAGDQSVSRSEFLIGLFDQFAAASNVRRISDCYCEGGHRPKAAFTVEVHLETSKSSGNAK